MKLFSKIFKKDRKTIDDVSPEEYDRVLKSIRNVQTIEDCNYAGKLIDNLKLPFYRTETIRNILCNNTFKVYSKNYPK